VHAQKTLEISEEGRDHSCLIHQDFAKEKPEVIQIV